MNMKLAMISGNRLIKAKRIRGLRGQSLVEFSLMIVLITILLLGVLDIGRAYFTFLALQDAAGEGANFAAVHPTWADALTSDNPDNVEYRVRHSSPSGTLVDWTTATVTVTTPGGTAVGQQVTVEVSTTYRLLTPFITTIVGSDTLTLKARSTATIIGID